MPDFGVLRIGPDAKARVYVMTDGQWTLSNNEVALPEGAYLIDKPDE